MEFLANSLCLDFANTVNKRPEPDRDYLATARDLRRWTRLAAAAHGPAVQIAAGRAAYRDDLLHEAIRLREAVYAIFANVVEGHEPADRDVAVVTAKYAQGLAYASLRPAGNAFVLTWPADDARRTLWAVAHDAVQHLLAGPLDRIGRCPSCRWLFVDISKNRQRRWCSMATCGSRDKSRHYYRRARGYERQ